MTTTHRHLSLVTTDDDPRFSHAEDRNAGRGAGAPETGDLILLASLFALNLVPVAGELIRVGRWSPGTVGFATAAALLTGRELWSQLRLLSRVRG